MAAATSDERSVEPRQEALHEPNVETVVFGDVLIKPWYPSFYPKELIGRKPDRLHVCKWCFKYSVEALLYATHVVRQTYSPTDSALTHRPEDMPLEECNTAGHFDLRGERDFDL